MALDKRNDVTVPDYLKDTNRELFGMVLDELLTAGVDVQPLDTVLIEMLVSRLSLIRQARKEGRHSEGEVASVYAEIRSDAWEQALSVARDLLLPEDAVRRLVWEH